MNTIDYSAVNLEDLGVAMHSHNGTDVGHESAPPTSPAGENPRKRPRTACTRCKTRKQKCDSQWPTCSNCEKSKSTCDKSIVGEPEPLAYTRALEERVAALEKELSRAHQHADSPDARIPHGRDLSGNNDHGVCTSENALRDVVDALNHGNFEEPAYVGSSSGLSLALNLGQMVQATVWTKAIPSTPDEGFQHSSSDQSDMHAPGHSWERRTITMEDIRINSARPPTDELGSKLIRTYLTRLHIRYPFLDPKLIWVIHSQRVNLASANVQNLSGLERFGIFKLYMVYAIGAMLLQLTEKASSHSPENFYMTALQHISAARESRSLHNVEAMMLLILYHLRSAATQGLWYMTGLAMRTCIDLGMHRATSETRLDFHDIQRRRLLFWSVYSLERIVSISLGRPCSVSDRHIDLRLPDDLGEQTILSPGSIRSLPYPIILYRLRRVESRIYNSIYRADRPLSSLRPKVDRLYADLEEWRITTQSCLTDTELEYPMLHYNKALRLLLQPFLLMLLPQDPYYQLCLRAAGEICQAHKRLHQSFEYGHSFIAVQTVFVAGITILYCLWTSTQEVWSIRLSNDIRACSAVLFVMGERANWVRKYRDAFEILVNATMQKLDSDAASPRVNVHVYTSPKRSVAAAHASITAASSAFAQQGTGNDEALRMVMELANWIDHDDGVEAWMPRFEHLENLTGSFDVNDMI